MARPSSKSRSPVASAQSLEASLAEENRAVLASLDKRSRSPLAKTARTATPPPQAVRSMLDVDGPAVRQQSIAKPILDPADPSTWTLPHASKPNSPAASRHGTFSEIDAQLPQGLPRIQIDSKRGFEQDYQFDLASMPSSSNGHRSASDAKKPRAASGSAMSSALSGDFSSLQLNDPTAAKAKPSGLNTRFPDSPHGRLLSPASPTGRLMSDATLLDDGNRRLSNKSNSFSIATDDAEEAPGRVQVDSPVEEEAVASSDEEGDRDTSPDDENRARGRTKKRNERRESDEGAVSSDAEQPNFGSEEPAKRRGQQVKSLIGPAMGETSPSGEHMLHKSTGVHPHSNFGNPRGTSQARSDFDIEADEIQKAKSLALNISPLDDRVADRHVRMLLRGDWLSLQEPATVNKRAPKLYLTCTDLSQEATYALEWTVGTLMRDGDTLLAIYAIEDETAAKVAEADREELHAEGATAGKDASDTMEALTRQTTESSMVPSSIVRSGTKFVPAAEAPTLTGSVDARKVSKKELERLKAMDSITDNFLKLVRKTTLQVRCMIEVIHCKSPKHLILGAIDELDPTMAVVGTRGRSSLKGVLLGSFSNYLVTKSSVPVMVARRKLKKLKHAKAATKIRLTNNLTNPGIGTKKRRGLESARID